MSVNHNAQEFDKLIAGYRKKKFEIIKKCAAMALAHFKQSFTDQGFTNTSLRKWPQRKGGARNKGRALLIDKGVLRRGIRIKSVNPNGAIVGVDEAIRYAQIQNEGGTIRITAQMRRFFWAMYYKHGGKNKGGRMNEVAEFWFNLALTKKTSIKIPKRQFIGDSVALERRMLAHIEQELKTFFQIS